MSSEPGREPNQIVVVIHGVEAVPVAEAMRLAVAFDTAFRAHTSDLPGGTRGLRLVDAGVGTWWMVLDDLFTIHQAANAVPDATAVFAKDLDTVVRILKEQRPQDTAEHLRALAKTLADTGKRLKADAVDVVSVVRIAVRAEHYGLIQRGAKARRPAPQSPREGAITASEKHVLMSATQAAERGELYGTVFTVHGQWYARAMGFGNVLLPLQLGSGHSPVDGMSYRIKGQVLSSARGWPQGIAVTELQRIGTAKGDPAN